MKLLTMLMVLALSVSAQVAPPKHEGRFRHIFSSHRDTNNLDQRFQDIRCALVLIQSRGKFGTGFYVNADGDIATAAHVPGDRKFKRMASPGIQVEYSVPDNFSLTDSTGKMIVLHASMIEFNPNAWLSDVALIKTGTKTKCWMSEADYLGTKPGEHLIAMGFPALAFGSLTIYTGIMSARLTTNFPTIILDTGDAVPAPNDFIRVQMPISGGLSGAPVVDDENRAIGIITSAGGWTRDLENLIVLSRMKAFSPPPPSSPQLQNTVTLNAFEVTAQLANLFHEYASPGYGDAVPLRYLRKAPQQSPPSSPVAH